jgi:hypothetical protein
MKITKRELKRIVEEQVKKLVTEGADNNQELKEKIGELSGKAVLSGIRIWAAKQVIEDEETTELHDDIIKWIDEVVTVNEKPVKDLPKGEQCEAVIKIADAIRPLGDQTLGDENLVDLAL